jgi:hypothetical protein
MTFDEWVSETYPDLMGGPKPLMESAWEAGLAEAERREKKGVEEMRRWYNLTTNASPSPGTPTEIP